MSITKYLTFLGFIMTLASCNKKSDNKPLTLNGDWELVSVESPWVGRQTFQPGNGNTYTFNQTSYTQKVNYPDTSYQTSGTFSVYRGKPCEAATSENSLIQFDTYSFPMVVSLARSTMTINPAPQCIFDGGTYTYRKIAD